ncbi:MAG: hypothetical protein HY698_19985 [Deltaproteobacteria bacterium]|nr:hypothetical protein [Deltaproteobacteria bacterium]
MGGGVTSGDPRSAEFPVLLVDGSSASGLAELLQQYLEQSIAGCATKVDGARRLGGAILFRPAEDDEVCVRVTFLGDRIELCDAPVDAPYPCIRADFLALAQIASGRASPVLLVLQGRVRLGGVGLALPRLFQVLRFMRTSDPVACARARRARWIALAVAVAALTGIFWWTFAR